MREKLNKAFCASTLLLFLPLDPLWAGTSHKVTAKGQIVRFDQSRVVLRLENGKTIQLERSEFGRNMDLREGRKVRVAFEKKLLGN
jgi:hypothetical protein